MFGLQSLASQENKQSEAFETCVLPLRTNSNHGCCSHGNSECLQCTVQTHLNAF